MRRLLSLFMLGAALATCGVAASAHESVRQSVGAIHNEIEDRERLDRIESLRRAEDNSNIGKRLSQDILRDASESADSATSPRYYKGYDPGVADAIRQNGKAEAEHTQRFYSEKAANVQGFAIQRKTLLEESALNLEQQLGGGSGYSETRILPLGTNLYVRNYVSPPALELVARQKKLTVKPKRGVSNAGR